MDLSALASDEFLNSNFFSTISTGLLSFSLICATVAIAIWQIIFQRKSHEENLLANRESRILKIYNTFVDSGRMFIALYPDLNLGVLPNENEYKKIQDFKIQLSNAYDEARLLFVDDAVIIGQLAKIQDKFLELNARERNLIVVQRDVLLNAVNSVRERFPNCRLDSLQDFVLNRDAFDALNKLTFSPEIQKLVDDIYAFRKNELSDANFDDYFKPYINRIPCKRKK